MQSQDASDRILINSGSEREIDLIRDMWRSPAWIALFHLDNGANQIGRRTFGPGLVFCFGENSSRYLRCTSARWKFNSVDGLNAIATRWSRFGLIQSEHNPAVRRSRMWRFGARRRERLRINNWCLASTDSATTARTPPGRTSLKAVVIRWTSRITRWRMRNPTSL